MTISADVNPELGAGLMARADALGVSPEEYLRSIVESAVTPRRRPSTPAERAQAPEIVKRWIDSEKKFPLAEPVSDAAMDRESMYPDRT